MTRKVPSQISVLLHKNLLLRKRSPCSTACEVLAPTVLAIIAGLAAYLIIDFSTAPIPLLPFPEIEPYPMTLQRNFSIPFTGTTPEYLVGFVPDTPRTRELADIILSEAFHPLINKTLLDTRFFSDIDKMKTAVSDYENGVGLGFILNEDRENNVNYTVFMNASLFPSEKHSLPQSANPSFDTTRYNSTRFVTSGAVKLGQILGSYFYKAKVHFSVMVMPRINDQSFQILIPMAGEMFSMVMGFALVPFFCINAGAMIDEKRSKMREYLFMLGLKRSAYWISWVITFLVSTLFTILPIIIVPYLFGAFHQQVATVIFFAIFTLISVSMLCMFFASFSNSNVVSIVVFVLLIFILEILFLIMPPTKAVHIIFCLFSPYAFLFASYKTVVDSFIKYGSNYSDCLSWGVLFTMVIVDSVIYALVAWYISETHPGPFGVKKPWNFLFTREYWTPEKTSNGDIELENRGSSGGSDFDYDEDHPESNFERREYNKGCGIEIRHLSKTFVTQYEEVHAVRDVTARFGKGEITALLGHNGAGKTTLISMLTGLTMATKGDATVNGYSIVHNMDNVRESLGICPQDDILYDNLTAPEHLELVGRLKGMQGTREEILKEAEQMLTDVYLGSSTHKNGVSSTFSGGMRRKLSLAMALFGNPEAVFLDEPTTGIDTFSRRSIWDALRRLKGEKTIILTTHSMEEADALCDWIHIMAHGKLRCSGSSVFLKQNFGVGNIITFAKDKKVVGDDDNDDDEDKGSSTSNEDSSPEQKQELNTEQVFDLVKEICPKAVLQNDSIASFQIAIPVSDGTEDFIKVLEMLEERSEELHLGEFGISLTSLEDVFVHVSEEAYDQDYQEGKEILAKSGKAVFDDDDMFIIGDVTEPPRDSEYDDITRKVPPAGVGRQIKAMAWYNWEYIKRNIVKGIFIIILPSILIALLVAIAKVNAQVVETMVGNDSEEQYAYQNSFFNSKDGPFDIGYIDNTSLGSTTNTDVQKLISLVTTNNIKFTQYETLDDLRRETFKKGYQYAGVIFQELDFKERSIDAVLLYNSTKAHSIMQIENLIATGFYRFLNGSDATLTEYTYAYSTSKHLSKESAGDMSTSYLVIGLFIGFIIGEAMISKRFVYERESMFKSQLIVSGMRPIIYSLANICFVFLYCVITSAVVVAVVAALGDNVHVPVDTLSLALTLYTFSATPFTFFISNVFPTAESSVKWNIVLQICLALLPWISMFVIAIIGFGKPGAETANKVINCIFYVLSPNSGGLGIITNLDNMRDLPLDQIFDSSTEPFRGVVCLSASFVGYLILSIIIEVYRAYLPSRDIDFESTAPPPDEDEDVAAERASIEESEDPNEGRVFVLKRLRKVFKSKGQSSTCCSVPDFIAVRGLSFGVKKNDCLGFLGPNGAGKSTTISMLTGELKPTSGKILLGGNPLEGTKRKAFSRTGLGRCMQKDALLSFCTPYEHLKIMHMCRSGEPEGVLERSTQRCLETVGLTEYANRAVGNLSGGNRRKLSVALTMIPGVRLLVFDEPSTGMDPITRRSLWGVIEHQKSLPGHSILLTTHSMEEADAICGTLAIMTRGQLRCIGSVQHLRSKFSKGYRISFAFPSTSKAETAAEKELCEKLLKRAFNDGKADIRLVDNTDISRTFAVPKPDSLASFYRTIEQGYSQVVGASAFSIAQASLEDLFIDLVRADEASSAH